MNAVFQEFIATYGAAILYALVTAIAGYVGIALKNLYTKYINDKTKQQVVKTCVKAVEQLYNDLDGEEKLAKCIEAASQMLNEKGIPISELEIRMLIEAAVNEINEKFNETQVIEVEPSVEVEKAIETEEPVG